MENVIESSFDTLLGGGVGAPAPADQQMDDTEWSWIPSELECVRAPPHEAFVSGIAHTTQDVPSSGGHRPPHASSVSQ